jgi:hypothetical protein
MKDISFLELVPIILAFHIWTPRFINKKILLRIDNQALVAIVNNRTSKSKYIMQLVRPLVSNVLAIWTVPNAQINKPHSPKMQTPHCQ